MRPTQAGTAILLCLGLAAIAVTLGAVFLRSLMRQSMSGRTEQLIALSREAAQSGLAHAVEQIMADHLAANLTVATTGGSFASTAPTFLDGPWRAPFVSLSLPGAIWGYPQGGWKRAQFGRAAEADDVAEENPLCGAAKTAGMDVYDGRGRFYEVGWYNTTRPAPTAVPAQPVAPLRFTDLSAGVPERADGIFLDGDLRRLDSGDPAADRRASRYRLRYAIGLIDLGGHPLINPLAEMNTDSTDPCNDYRNTPLDRETAAPNPAHKPWLEAAANAWYNMVETWQQGPTLAVLSEHVFRGRGNISNLDRDDRSTRLVNGVPQQHQMVTFPMMFRGRGEYNVFARTSYWPGGEPAPYLAIGLWSVGDETAQPMYSSNRCYATPAGGDRIHHRAQMTDLGGASHPITHTMVGPQASWHAYASALRGHKTYYGGGGGGPGYGDQYGYVTPHTDLLVTPFGRRLEKSTAAPANWKWYQGRIDTPFHVNVLTAPSLQISQMLLAAMPSHVKTLHWYKDEYYNWTGFHIATDSEGRPYRVEEYSPTISSTKDIDVSVAVRGRDLWTRWVGSGLSEFPAPTSISPVDGSIIDPDYYQMFGGPTAAPNGQTVPYDPRPASARYPGPLMRSGPNSPDDGAPSDQVLDDLAKDIKVGSKPLPIGNCTHSGEPLIYIGGSDQEYYAYSDPPPNPNHPSARVVRRLQPGLFKPDYQRSYWWPLAKAMSSAIAYVRATWVQYPNNVFDPAVGFNPASLRDAQACSTLEDLDRAFLRQLGENFDTPGDGVPLRPITSTWADSPATAISNGHRITFSVDPSALSNTIRTLADVTADRLRSTFAPANTPGISVERAKVMERMLNDFRMSFLGAGPGYSETFRPLDFDGDGKVMGSCYAQNPAATPEEKTFRTDRWKPVDAGHAKPGRGPMPDSWFTVTGCFYIGKSHHFRIFCRGEVYDNVLRKPVAQQTVDAVWVADPDGVNPRDSRMIFQRWEYNRSTSELPRQLR